MDTTLITSLGTVAGTRAEGITEEAFDLLVRQHQRRVYRVIYLMLRDSDAADTLTQECFLRAYQHRSQFRGECRVDTWLLRIAVNLVRDHGKSRRTSFWKRLVGLEIADDGDHSAAFTASEPSAERAILAHEELLAVWCAVKDLSQQQQAIFVLRFVEELSLAQIAEVLKVRIGSVKAQLNRATSKIRKIVREK